MKKRVRDIKLPKPEVLVDYFGYEKKYLNKTDKTIEEVDTFYEEEKASALLRTRLFELRKQKDPRAYSDNKECYIFKAGGKTYAAMRKDSIFRLGLSEDLRDY